MKLRNFKQVAPVVGLAGYLALGVVSTNAISPEMRREAAREWKTEVKVVKKANRPILMNADVTGINGTVIAAARDGKTYTINTTTSTLFARRFGGKSSISEFTVGDKINVRGTTVDDTGLVINATYIKDISIFKRQAAFTGIVKSISENTMVITTTSKGDQTMVLDTETKLVNKNGKAIAKDQIMVGDKVSVFGVWNANQNRMIETDRVRDMSLPRV